MDLSMVIGAVDRETLHETQRIARVASWEANLLTETIIWSEVVKEIHEVAPNYQPGFSAPLDFYKEDYRESLMRAMQNTINDGSLFDIEAIIITAKGNERWIRVTGRSELRDGTCIRIYGAIQDIHDRKIAELALLESRNRFESLLQTVDGIVWEADVSTLEFTFVSDQAYRILGYPPEDWIKIKNFWLDHIHPDDREQAIGDCHRQALQGRKHIFDYRMISADGNIVWLKDIVSVIKTDSAPTLLRGVMVDVTETKRFEILEQLEKTVLELNSKEGRSLEEVLSEYLLGIEQIYPRMKCSIVGIVDGKLSNWSSPSLPVSYTRSIEGLQIGALAGSCGTAAYLKEKVIVSDIENDPRWANHVQLALSHNLHACWSHPILDSDGNVTATFAIYYDHIKTPDENELKVIDRAVAILKVILENKKNSEIIISSRSRLGDYLDALRLSNERYELVNKATNDAIYDWDILTDSTSWGNGFTRLFGFEITSTAYPIDEWLSKIHPADLKRAEDSLYETLSNTLKSNWTENYRFRKADGSYAYVEENGHILRDADGRAIRMIGVLRDMTKQKQEELKLQEIAYMQSHVVRAPLARLMGLVDLIKNYQHTDIEKHELMDHLLFSARELDAVIRDISGKTE